MSRVELARALIEARDAHLLAIVKENEARQAYVYAEEAYLQGTRDEPASNVLIDGTLIQACEEWWDAKKGTRLTFHAVEVLA
jgi:hypothetical protein